MLLQGYGPTKAILLTPLFFGVAHLHHAYDFVVHQGCSLHDALLMVTSSTPFHPSKLLPLRKLHPPVVLPSSLKRLSHAAKPLMFGPPDIRGFLDCNSWW